MTATTVAGPARIRLALAVLFAGAFVMSCAEMLVVGLIDRIADDLTVSLPAAGALVTANALGLAIGGPVLTVVTSRLDRRVVLLATLALFVALTTVPVIGAGYPAFLAVRAAIGAAQGLFLAAAFTSAAGLVPPERAGRAMSVVIAGSATASALGLPIGTVLGQLVGWRGAFAAVVAVAVVVLAGAAALVPRTPGAAGHRVAGQARAAFAPRVLAIVGLCALIFAAIQSALTYLVPLVTEVSGVTGAAVGLFLLAYGVATTVGSSLGGRFADADAARTLLLGCVGVLASLLTLALLGGSPIAAALAVLGMGVFGMGMAPSMQHRVVSLAGVGGPVAASLPSSGANAGIALGALLGGAAIDVAGLPAVAVVGAAVAMLAIAAAAVTAVRIPSTPQTAATD